MNRKTLAMIATLSFMSGCDDCGPTPTDPCEGFNCNHGTCSVVNDQPNCTCKDGWEGNCDTQNLCFGLDLGNGVENCDHASGKVTCKANWYDGTKKCQYKFDPTDPTFSLACKQFNPSDSGRLEVSGKTGTDSRYNGYYVDIQAGTFARSVWVCLKDAQGQNLPDPNRPGGTLLPKALGIDVSAIDAETPFLVNGDYNTLEPTLDTELLLYGHRGTVLFYNDSAKAFEDVSFTIVEKGSLGKTRHFSPYYLLDTLPTLEVVAMQESGMTVLVDFDGTTDEQSGTLYFLDLSATEGGILQVLTPVAGQDKKFRITLSGGTHTLVFKVLDPNGSEAEKSVVVVVDLCTGKTCQPWQTCRTLDGVCIGSDPCDPNPCVHGTCGNSTGQAVCACAGNWSGGLCDTCPPGYTGNDCHVDLCYQVGCNSHGTCNPMSGACACDTGYDTLQSCGACSDGYKGYPNCAVDLCHNVNCPDDGNLCNGTESCDPGTGTCIHSNPVICPDDGNPCNGTEQCNTANGTCEHVNPVICPDDGDKCNGQEACNTTNGQCIHANPVTCPDDNNVCNGTEQCETATGNCVHVSPLTCDDGARCNGTETCSPTLGCIPGTAETCSGHGSCHELPAAICACGGNWTGTHCETCPADSYIDGNGDCVTDHCQPDPCNGHATACDRSNGSCTCATGFAGSTCNTCDTGYGPGYPVCYPKPVMTVPQIDCGTEPCWAGGTVYTVTFSVTNAISCTANAVRISGLGTSGSTSACVVNGNTGSFTFTTGSTAGDVIRITGQVVGPGGTDSKYVDVHQE